MSSRWNRWLDLTLERHAELTSEEYRLLLAIARCALGFNASSATVGTRLLRQMSGLHGRSFGRALEGLQRLGLVRCVPPATTGRGNRGTYHLLLGPEWQTDEPADVRETPASARDFPETPAPSRDFRDEETPASARTIGGESPAETPAEARARRGVRVKSDDDEDVANEFETNLEGLGPITRSQRQLFAGAYAQSPDGLRDCVAQAKANGKKPVALLTALLKNGQHLNASRPATRLDRWFANAAPTLPLDHARLVLEDNFKLTGPELADANERLDRLHQGAA